MTEASAPIVDFWWVVPLLAGISPVPQDFFLNLFFRLGRLGSTEKHLLAAIDHQSETMIWVLIARANVVLMLSC